MKPDADQGMCLEPSGMWKPQREPADRRRDSTDGVEISLRAELDSLGAGALRVSSRSVVRWRAHRAAPPTPPRGQYPVREVAQVDAQGERQFGHKGEFGV